MNPGFLTLRFDSSSPGFLISPVGYGHRGQNQVPGAGGIQKTATRGSGVERRSLAPTPPAETSDTAVAFGREVNAETRRARTGGLLLSKVTGRNPGFGALGRRVFEGLGERVPAERGALDAGRELHHALKCFEVAEIDFFQHLSITVELGF